MLPSLPEERANYAYAQGYGEKKLMSELLEYEKITGKNWADALKAFDSVSYGIEKFHKEVVIPFLSRKKE